MELACVLHSLHCTILGNLKNNSWTHRLAMVNECERECMSEELTGDQGVPHLTSKAARIVSSPTREKVKNE